MKPPVPDFFQGIQDKDLRSQAKWLEDNLGLDRRFFIRVAFGREAALKLEERAISDLYADHKSFLRDFWRVVLHLMSHYNFDSRQVRRLFGERTPAQSTQQRRLPWSGSSLKDYFEEHGVDAVADVNRWVTSLRFGDPYASGS